MPAARTHSRRDPPSCSALRSLCLALLLLASSSSAAIHPSPSPRTPALSLFKRLRGSQIAPGVSPAGPDYWCRVEGECLPCPPGARDSDVCKIYGNRRPLICVQRHSTTTTHHAETFRDDNGDDEGRGDGHDDDRGEQRLQSTGKNKDKEQEKGKGKQVLPVKPLVEPAGSQAEADDLAREDRETFGSSTHNNDNNNNNKGLEGEKIADADSGSGTKAPGLSKADQELQDELQAERRRRVRTRRRSSVRDGYPVAGRQGGPISTWEACPKVLHSEHHDYFEFILCNAGFAALAIAVLVFRQRTLALQQFGRLAARIMQTQSSAA
ncbi:hypothetical protein JCM3774_003535 [Rhodotorula dairenensis]